MKDGERERPIENNGKKEQKEWLDNILPDPHPCTAGNKEEEHNTVTHASYVHVYLYPRTHPRKQFLLLFFRQRHGL